MGRIRSLKPEYATSLSVADLTERAMLHFALLWTYADDEGRGIDDPRLIKAAIWPLRDAVTIDVVEALQAELAAHGRIQRYEVAGRRYFQIHNFGEHQHPNRPRPSDLPEPPGDEQAEPVHEQRSAPSLHAPEDAPAVGEGRGEGEEQVHCTALHAQHRAVHAPGSSPPAPKEKRASRLPQDWTPSDQLRHWARTEHPAIDLDRETAKFHDYWAGVPGAKGRKVNWDSTWRNWIRNAADRAPRTATSRRTNHDDALANWQPGAASA